MTLRRARFLLPTTTDDADEVASLPPSDAGDAGDPRGKKAEYWDGYRAAMATKAPPFTGSIASFDSDDPDEISLDGRVAELPRSPSVSDEDEPLQELETEQRLAGALAAGATVGLPGAGALAAAPSEQELAEEAAEAEAEAAAARAELAPGAAAWVDRLGKWEAVLAKAPATYMSLHACMHMYQGTGNQPCCRTPASDCYIPREHASCRGLTCGYHARVPRMLPSPLVWHRRRTRARLSSQSWWRCGNSRRQRCAPSLATTSVW